MIDPSAAPAGTRLLYSGNEAVARAVWESGVRLATAYPGTPSTEILETLALYPDLTAQWGVNEKVALEAAIGAALAGGRAFCAMKHVGVNVASDALMSQTLAGINAGLVLAVADDVGLSSSQNEQDSRYWGRFAHLPVIEPADAQEALAFTKMAFEISELFGTPVILRMTTRVCHVKTLVEVGERKEPQERSFIRDPRRWVMLPVHAREMIPRQFEREKALSAFGDTSELNTEFPGSDRSIGIVSSGPAALSAREAAPDTPLLKLGFSCPLPLERIRAFAQSVDQVLVVEETEPLIENELKAAGLAVHGKDVLPRTGELSVPLIRSAVARLKGEPEVASEASEAAPSLFPRPPTLCPGCPHLSPFYSLSKLHDKVIVSGDIGCYTLGAGQPWRSMDLCTCMGASLSMAGGLSVAKGPGDEDKSIVAVIGDSTFLHMGLQGMLNLVYNNANVTVLLLDNRSTGMTGGQEHPGTGYNLYGETTPRVDLVGLVKALGVPEDRVFEIDPYALPEMYKTLRNETRREGVSVIVTNRPCVLTSRHKAGGALTVDEDRCTGCGNCLAVGCPAIEVVRREERVLASGKTRELSFVRIDSAFCTGCGVCAEVCGPKAIQPLAQVKAGALETEGA
ncbi:4Fe-4S dicluster domain-containing protein [Phaeovibrio sulfidiphilus]|uniref:Indolepyruvate oxidoreductase subunit IorA n=1 Tax=Phaeovibrio sulfidiphilus TaxID=1220600 RepID=A0A8J7CVK3_9PROT|nr:thiamine pyrophosphate-dependent enzyme [Phaeovibrio sulfidiphilus]MBE1236406.1 4Fe-4S dicluster domain-containing protein [Phaeovibrio sulfidiphilus]